MATEVKERKIMTKEVLIGKSKTKGTFYLYVKVRDEKYYFVNLVKDNKKFAPKIPTGSKSCVVEFTSFLYDDENNRLVLFDVRDIVFKG